MNLGNVKFGFNDFILVSTWDMFKGEPKKKL
jgi:hypothetical protein